MSTARDVALAAVQVEKARIRARPQLAPLDIVEDNIFEKNTFIDHPRPTSPSLAPFYQERQVHSCPSQLIGRMKACLDEMAYSESTTITPEHSPRAATGSANSLGPRTTVSVSTPMHANGGPAAPATPPPQASQEWPATPRPEHCFNVQAHSAWSHEGQGHHDQMHHGGYVTLPAGHAASTLGAWGHSRDATNYRSGQSIDCVQEMDMETFRYQEALRRNASAHGWCADSGYGSERYYTAAGTNSLFYGRLPSAPILASSPVQVAEVPMPRGCGARAGPPAAAAPAPVPPPPRAPAPGSREVPSIGSAGHGSGRCKPCAFFHTKGCASGPGCHFCHRCGPDEKKNRRKQKLASRQAFRECRKACPMPDRRRKTDRTITGSTTTTGFNIPLLE